MKTSARPSVCVRVCTHCMWLYTVIGLFAFEFACASMCVEVVRLLQRVTELYFSVYICGHLCFLATGQDGLVSLAIDKAEQLRLLVG